MSFVLLMLLLENNRLYARLAESRGELRRLAVIDPLTRVANRRAFDDAIDEEWRRAVRNNTTIALLLIDVDRFKTFNDMYGHVTGITVCAWWPILLPSTCAGRASWSRATAVKSLRFCCLGLISPKPRNWGDDCWRRCACSR